MPLHQEIKTEIITENQIHSTDTGSSDIQIAVLTKRIKDLTEHLKEHKHDFATRRGLIKMVGRRRRLLRYLRRTNIERHDALVQRLGIKSK